MIQTITFEDYKTTDWWNGTHLIFHTLYDPSVGYYPCHVYTTAQDDDTFTVDRLADGTPMVRDHSGDVLCNTCAEDYLTNEAEAAVTAASGIDLTGYNDCQIIECTDCSAVIHQAPDTCGPDEDPIIEEDN